MKIKEIELTPEEIDYLLKGNIHWNDLQEKNEPQVRKPIKSISLPEISNEPPKRASSSINVHLKRASINTNEPFEVARIKESFPIKEANGIKDIKGIKEIQATKEIRETKGIKDIQEAKDIKDIKANKGINKTEEIKELKVYSEIEKINDLKEVNENKPAEEFPSLNNSNNNFQKYVECTNQDSLEKELCQQAVIKEFFPDWKPLPRKEIKNNEEKGQVLQGKSDPNEWAKRLERMKELEKKAQEQTSKEDILGDDFRKEKNVRGQTEDFPEDNLDYDDLDDILPGEKSVLSGPKVYVLLSMMGCITIGTWLYFVFSH